MLGTSGPDSWRRRGILSGEGIQGYLIGLALAVAADGGFVLRGAHGADLGAGNPGCARRPRHRADRRAPRFLSAPHDCSGQHQQRAGAGVRRIDCGAGDRRFVVDHGPPEPQHDAHASDDADAAVTGSKAANTGTTSPLTPEPNACMQMHTIANVRRRTGNPA